MRKSNDTPLTKHGQGFQISFQNSHFRLVAEQSGFAICSVFALFTHNFFG